MNHHHNSEKLICWLNKIPRLIQIIILLAGILVSVTLAYAAVNARTKANSEKIQDIKQKADSNEIAIVSIQKDIEYIKKGVDEIKLELKN